MAAPTRLTLPTQPHPTPPAAPVERVGQSRWPGQSALAFVVALLVYLVVLAVVQPMTVGDEPHYLVYAYTLVHDHRVNLAPTYASGVTRQFSAGPLSADHQAYDYLGNGALISVHNLGLPLLIAPVLARTNSVLAVRVELALIGALTAWQLFLLLQESGLAAPGLVWLAFGATAFSLPFLTFTNQIFPDGPAAFLTVFAARMLLSRARSPRRLYLAAVAAATLPWLHVRFLILAAGILLAATYQLGRRWSWRRALPALGIGLGSLALMAVAFSAWYGSPLPTAPYQAAAYGGHANLGLPGLPQVYFYGLGQILSPENGWLPFAPVQWISLAGLALFARRRPSAAAWALVVFGGYLVVSTDASGIGDSLPGRYLVPLVPLAALTLATALQALKPLRILAAGLLVVTAGISVAAVVNAADLYPRGEAQSTGATILPVAASLQGVWPDFQSAGILTSFVLTPIQTHQLVGKLIPSSGSDGSADARAYAAPGPASVGFLAYGRYLPLAAGIYRADFVLAAVGPSSPSPVATLDVRAPPGQILASASLTRAAFRADGVERTFTLTFTLPEPAAVEPRVYDDGQASIWLDRITVAPIHVAPRPDPSYPGWPVSLAWLLGTAAAGGVLWRLDRRQGSANRAR
jgi:hypothetical protein